jgi:hypothetical protein
VGDFFAKRGGDVLKATEIAKKPRRNISSVIAGKAITEIDASQIQCKVYLTKPLVQSHHKHNTSPRREC